MRCVFTVTLLAIVVADVPAAAGQSAAWWNKDWKFRRMVSARHRKSGPDGQEAAWITLPTNRALGKNARDLRVVTPSGVVLPHLIMRVGPGDLVTVAFPLRPAYGRYYIYYGNPAAEPAADDWRPKRGVLLEGWRFSGGAINTLDQVRRAFKRAARRYEGATFVPNIFLGLNPFSNSRQWCHRYTGYLHIKRAGDYGLATTSDDASFVLIDDKLVVGWGGLHGFRGDAKYNKTIRLEPGLHKLTYLQVNQNSRGGAVAAWRPPAKEPKWEVIPPTAFAPIVDAKLGKLERRGAEHQSDFVFANVGEAFAKNQYTHRFAFETGPGLLRGSGVKYAWDFGDGVTSDRRRVEHIYLLPGSYDVKLTVTRGRNSAAIINRVRVERDWARVDRREIDDIDDHLASIKPTDLLDLSGRHLWQLLMLTEGKPRFDALFGTALEAIAERGGDLRAGHTAQLIGWIRDDLVEFQQKPDRAADLLLALERSATTAELGIVFAAAAGRILIDDLHDLSRARELFERLLKQYEDRAGADSIRAARIGLGDVYRLDGDYERSRALYLEAGMKGEPRLANILVGHLQRSVEYFTKEGQLEVAEGMLDTWETDYPMQRLYGLSTLARMRLHIARNEHAAAIRCGEALLAVNEDSLYAAEILFELGLLHRRGRDGSKAAAIFESLIDRHPESPLVERARDLLETLSP